MSPARKTGAGAARKPPRSSAPPAVVPDALRAKVLEVHRRLCAEYGCPIGYFHDLDPLSELVSSLLSHRTKNSDSGRAFRQLRQAFPSWTAVRDAPVAEVEVAIRPATWPELKAPRIQATLGEIATRLAGTPGEALGDDALDFLGALPVREARDWLESITGVGPKTSAAVLSFSRLRLPALPVDSHHHRVAVRLGLIPEHVDVGPAHAWLEAQLPPDWSAQQVYDNHEVLMLHGQHVCHWRDPECARCVVLDLCPTGEARLGAPDPRDHNGGALAGTGQGVPEARDPRAQEWTLTLQPSNEGDDEPLHHLRLRLSLQDEKLWRLRVIAPRPDSVESHGGGRYFGWSSLPARATVQLRLAAPRSVHQASSLKLMWTADGFEALPLLVRPFARRAATRTGSRWALAGIVPVNRSH